MLLFFVGIIVGIAVGIVIAYFTTREEIRFLEPPVPRRRSSEIEGLTELLDQTLCVYPPTRFTHQEKQTEEKE